MKVNLRDTGFAHHTISPYATLYGTSNLIEWDRTCSQTGPTVYTDSFLNDEILQYPGEKIAWLMEPAAISPYTYEWVYANSGVFAEVWSHNRNVLKQIILKTDTDVAWSGSGWNVPYEGSIVWVPGSGCWIDEPDCKISEKTKLCSLIASNKNYAPGHHLRQRVRAVLPPAINTFGRGFSPIEHKIEGLRDYAFSIAIENSMCDAYFTEKIIDCFLTGTIPIYWGSHAVCDWFHENGIIFFDEVDDLLNILSSLSMSDYEKRISAIRANFEMAKRFKVPEEWGIRRSRALTREKKEL